MQVVSIKENERMCVLVSILSRVVTVLIGVIGKVEDYDRSGELIFPRIRSEWIRRIVGPSSNWDGVYFLRIASRGKYEHEQVHAFFPGLPLLIRGIHAIVGDWLGVEQETDQLVLIGWLVSNVAFVLGNWVLYKLTADFYRRELATVVSVIYSVSGCSVFMSAIYTESLFGLLCFACIYALEKNKFALGTLAAMSAGLVRANATFLAVYFVFIGARKGRGWTGLLGSLCIVATVQTYLVWSKSLYCTDASPSVPDWCESGSIYGYVQKRYWDVGLLGYWQMKNIGFFLLALPTIIIAMKGIVWAFAQDYARSVWQNPNGYTLVNRLVKDRLTPYIAYLVICLLVCIFIANVQIITRLVSSSPAYYWGAAHLFTAKDNAQHVTTLLLYIHMVYFAIGPILFGNVLPWT